MQRRRRAGSRLRRVRGSLLVPLSCGATSHCLSNYIANLEGKGEEKPPGKNALPTEGAVYVGHLL